MRVKICLLLLIVVGLLVFSNTLANGFIGDDYYQILTNTAVHTIKNVPRFFTGSTYASGNDTLTGIYYRPVMLSVYALITTFFGLNPAMFHLFQYLLHIANAILLFFFFRYFFKNTTAFIGAMLFLVAPVNNEAVVYIANLQDPLFFFFGLIGLILQRHMRQSWKSTLAVGTALILSLFSKETGIVFVFMVIADTYLFKKKQAKGLLYLVPFVGLYLFCRFWLAHMYTNTMTTVAPISRLTLPERLLSIPAIIVYYIKIFFLPIHLSATQYWIVQSADWAHFYFPLLFLTIVSLVLYAQWKWLVKRHKKYSNVFFLFLIWLGIGLALHLQIIPLDVTIADRWFYFPAAGLIGLICVGVEQIRLKQPVHRTVAIGALVLIFALLGIRTFLRNYDWHDEITLYAQDLQIQEPNFLLQNAYGTALINDHQYTEAKPYVLDSVTEYPYYANLNNLAIIYLHEKNIPEAKKYLQRALVGNSNYLVYDNYASFLLQYGTPEETIQFTSAAIKKFPTDTKLREILRKAKEARGNSPKV